MDVFSKDKRSVIMGNIHSRNTKPELLVRKLLCELNYKNYRLQTSKLSFKPDIVYPGQKKAIFVNGCFWHAHGCQNGRLPKTNTEYWESKINSNKTRDHSNYMELSAKGWSYMVIWGCELNCKNRPELIERILFFMSS